MAGSLLCARPGCQGIVAAWFTYDYDTQRVWLDDSPSAAGGHHWALCAEHAGRLRPPRGWERVDRRIGVGSGPGAAAAPQGEGCLAAAEPAGDAELGTEAGSEDTDLENEVIFSAELADPRRLVS